MQHAPYPGAQPAPARPSLFRPEALAAQSAGWRGAALQLGQRLRKLSTPMVFQAETAECGLACMAMVLSAHGRAIDLATLRQRHRLSPKGASLPELMQVARDLSLRARPLRVELQGLANLRLPCLLHWDFNHFVVLTEVRRQRVTVHDPARGMLEFGLDEASVHFTGVALELTPDVGFELKDDRHPPRLADLLPRESLRAAPLLGVLGIALALQLLVMAAPLQLQWSIDHVVARGQHDLLSTLALGFGALALLQVGLAALRSHALARLGAELHLELMTRLLRHLVRLPMGWFGSRQTGDITSKFDSLAAIQRTLTTGFIEAVLDGLMAIATLGMMFVCSPQLTAISLAATALLTGWRAITHRPLQAANEARLVHGARQHGHFLETLRGIQCLKLFGQEEARATRWQNLAVSETNANLRVQRLEIGQQGIQALVLGLEGVVTLWAGARMVSEAGAAAPFTIGTLLAYIAYKTQFVQRAAALVDKGLQLRILHLHVDRVADITASATEPRDPPCTDVKPLRGALALRDLSFRHAAHDPWLFDKLSLRIEAGESVAIVGPSGCGKSTLMKLMLGLLEPAGGSVEVDGQSLAAYGLHRFRTQVASVMQDDQLFAGSILENIAFFAACPDFEAVQACAQRACVHDDIVAMPMGYHTLVGDMGSVLSGGQKQRVLLARALYRQPSILFLDEATSHLDIACEREVNAAVKALPLTRIIIAHRPETIASADRVLDLGARLA